MDNGLLESRIDGLIGAFHHYGLPESEGLKETPRRAARFWRDFLSGADVKTEIILGTTFPVGPFAGPVIVEGIKFASVCEHHLLPFVGTATVAYVPGERIVGLSKIPRLVDALARKPQTQEALTASIYEALQVLQPKGVRVELTAEHLCMSMRGIQARGTTTTTRMIWGETV